MISSRAIAWFTVGLIVVWWMTLAARGAVHASRTGSSGVHFPSGKEARAGLAATAFGIAGFAFLAASLVLQIRGRLDPWLGSWFSVGVGIALVIAGGAIVVAGQAAMGASWRVGVDFNERTDLATKGLFTLSRNPIYAGLILSLSGFALLTPSWWSLTGFVLSVAGTEVQVRLVEEPYLLKAHGDDYSAYASRVGRFIPGFGRGIWRDTRL